MTNKKKIFLIDDSSVEAILLNHAINESEKAIELESFTNSVEAFEELINREEFNNNSLPRLILLDLNMPGFSGIDFLKKIRKIDAFKKMPILIFTSSNLESDKVNCIEAGANSVIVKPSGIDKYKEVIKAIFADWLES